MLEQLFERLGYNSQNGLYILENSEEAILNAFPSRISRVLIQVIKPYAVFCSDIQSDLKDHVKPFNNPLILFYNEPTEKEYKLIPKHSFNLSRSPLIIINKGNAIEIFNGFDFSDHNPEWLESIEIDLDLLSIDNLRSGKGWKVIHEKYFKKIKTVDRFLLSNITDARRVLIAKELNFPEGNLSPEVANRLIGRLIFIRYLIDRNVAFNDQTILIGNNKIDRQNALNEILLNHKKTYDFFEYINHKFKGDLFPLVFENEGLPFFERNYVRQENLYVLYYLLTCSNMFVGEKVRGYSVQRSLFNVYDFEIIPVELISNIYESFLGNTVFSKVGKIVTELSKQKEVKAYYTPPFLVDYVLSQTVKPHLASQMTTSCKVLDPSCGSGIFLVETLRQIIDKEIRENFNFQDKNGERIGNDRLWELLQDNIFGVDIDQNAIEITIFSLYITLLDYKTHSREIEKFEFRSLEGTNLFGGSKADIFNTENQFNKVFKEDVKLNFIVGNPPWGHVKNSTYVDYIKKKSINEKKAGKKAYLPITIGNKEISQAFMIRVADFLCNNHSSKICLIVTGKNLYNSDISAVNWRKYLLSNFNIHQVFDLFGVNNKVAGGKQLFDNANQPPAIIFYSKKCNEDKNIIKHIVARANQYYHYFKTIVIEKNDVQHINQELFLSDDSLWKIMLYGNSLDYLFINKIRANKESLNDYLSRNELQLKGGYKAIDSGVPIVKRKDTHIMWDFDYIELEGEKGLRQYGVESHKNFKTKLIELYENGKIREDFKVAQIPNVEFFRGKKLLVKKGLDRYLNHLAVSAFCNRDSVFSSTVASITNLKGEMNEDIENDLYAVSAIVNSKLFLYYLLMTSSSFGAGRNRLNFVEFLNMPLLLDSKLTQLSKDIHCLNSDNVLGQNNEKIKQIEKKIEKSIYKLYDVDNVEVELINYALDVSIPIMKRADRTYNDTPSIFLPIKNHNLQVITSYCQVFLDHFSKRFNDDNRFFLIDVFINADFIAVHYKISQKRNEIIKYLFESQIINTISKIGNIGVNEVSSELFIQQDIRGFNRDSFYIVKPNVAKNWHLALAHLDLTEFIEAIAMSEMKKTKMI